MVYFRELPCSLKNLDDWFLQFFFKFANTYTVESVLNAYIKEKQDKEKKPTKDIMKVLGYSEEDILGMKL